MLRSSYLLLILVTLLAPWFGATTSAAPSRATEVTTSSIYWGALIDGRREGFDNPPWDMRGVDAFEARTNKQMSVLHIGFPWYNSVTWPYNKYYRFVPSLFDTLHARGIIPLVTWAPWDGDIASSSTEQPKFALSTIIRGDHDAFITKWATDARNWGHPFFLRFAWEMNGDWYPWSEARNGNTTGQYVQAWQHVHNIFTKVGATNVTWVWSAVVDYPGSLPLEGLYPGDAYVDWVGMDGYNWPRNAGWQSFSNVFKPTYDHMQRLAPSKPIMLTEVASAEQGGSKAAWITDALTTQLPQNFPNIKAVVWFNWNLDDEQWVIESSEAATRAFRQAITTSTYASSNVVNVSGNGKIAPLTSTRQVVRSFTVTNADAQLPGPEHDWLRDGIEFNLTALPAPQQTLESGIAPPITGDVEIQVDPAGAQQVAAQPLTLSIGYTDAEIAGVAEESLTLLYRSGDRWIDAATTCAPTSSYVRDLSAQRLSITICPQSILGLEPPTSTRIFLPRISR